MTPTPRINPKVRVIAYLSVAGSLRLRAMGMKGSLTIANVHDNLTYMGYVGKLPRTFKQLAPIYDNALAAWCQRNNLPVPNFKAHKR